MKRSRGIRTVLATATARLPGGTVSRVAALMLVLTAVESRALQIELQRDHLGYIRFEPVQLVMKIRNDSASPLVADRDDPEWNMDVNLVVRRQGVGPVKRRGEADALKTLRLQPNETRTLLLNLSRVADLGSMGRYIVSAVAVVGGQRFESEPIVFDVVRGLECASVQRALSGYPERIRTYSLRYWPRKSHEYLFLSVDEEDSGYNYGVFQLARVLRIFKPRLRVGRDDMVSVLHQSAHDRYVRSIFRSLPDEVLFIDQQYLHADGSPYTMKSEPPASVPAAP